MTSKKQNVSLAKRAQQMAAGTGGGDDRWKPRKPGDSIEGKVVSIEERQGAEDTFNVCFLDTGSGIVSFGLNSVLQRIFEANEIVPGDVIGVCFKEQLKPKTKGFTGAKIYTVAIDGRATVRAEMQKPARKPKRKGRK